jgi:hypothetical protein
MATAAILNFFSTPKAAMHYGDEDMWLKLL